MPEKQTIERARRDKREGKAPTTQAGEFVREEIEHIRKGKHGARSAAQAIASAGEDPAQRSARARGRREAGCQGFAQALARDHDRLEARRHSGRVDAGARAPSEVRGQGAHCDRAVSGRTQGSANQRAGRAFGGG